MTHQEAIMLLQEEKEDLDKHNGYFGSSEHITLAIKALEENSKLFEIVKEYYYEVMWQYHRNVSAVGLEEEYLKLKAIVEERQ